MLVKKLTFLCLIVAVSCLQMKANGTTKDTEEKMAAEVVVRQSEDLYEVYARAKGCGYTLESAKLAAMNNLLPQLINKTMNIGALTSYTIIDGVKKGEGADNITGKMAIQGYWKMENDIYQYQVELLMHK